MQNSESHNYKKHIKQLIRALSSGVWEKDQLLALGILCGISDSSLFLLGPPGTGKSLIARRVKEIFEDSTAFEYLMSRFSTPDEIFGPVSIRKLREEDCYERSTGGYLPSADVVFLDEIWKAGPAIQNALLTVLNEKIFQNGAVTMKLPLKVLIAASNELPREDEGLEALWDRFMVRCISDCIENENSFYKMLRQTKEETFSIEEPLKISSDLLDMWKREAADIVLPDPILRTITRIRSELKVLSKAENTDPLDYYISDRRWKKAAQILRTSALLNDRDSVDPTDLLLLKHMLWNKTECMKPDTEALIKSLFAEIQTRIDDLSKEIGKTVPENKGRTAANTGQTTFKVYNYFYAKLLPSTASAEKGDMYFVLNDYSQLSLSKPANGIRYRDEKLGGDIIRTLGATAPSGGRHFKTVTLRRGNDSVFINGEEFLLEKSGSGTGISINSIINRQSIPDISRLHLEEFAYGIRTDFDSLRDQLVDNNSNIFIFSSDLRPVKKYVQVLERTLNALEVKIKSMQPDGV